MLLPLRTALVCLAAAVVGQTAAGPGSRLLAPAGPANALVFVSTDCPVSNSYAPEIQRICDTYSGQGVGCALVYEDPGLSEHDMQAHVAEHHFRGIAAVRDAGGAIAVRLGATITPEAFLVDHSGTVRYHGRIDNFYAALGKSRQVVTAHDLRNALDAVLAGQPVAQPRTEAIGCFIIPPHAR